MKKNKPLNRRDFLKTTSLASAFFIVPRFVLGRGFIAPSDRINLGFIGCGKQSNGLQQYFLNTGQVQFVGASDVYKAKMDRFIINLNKTNIAKGLPATNSCLPYPDFRELLHRKEVDAVIIAVPDHWHSVIAVKACEAGKDVYCEKPLSKTVAEGRAMVNAARKYNRVFQTGSMQRSWPEFRQAVELVRNGYIGEITKVVVNIDGPPKQFDLAAESVPDGLDWKFWLGPNTTQRPYNKMLAPNLAFESEIWPQWRAYDEFGGGGMTDWGAHMFDIAQWGLNMDNSGPVKIIPPAAGQNQGLLFEYSNGIQMIHQNNPGAAPSCQFTGTKGSVLVQRGLLTTNPVSLKEKIIWENEQHVYLSTNHYQDFINALHSRKMPVCDVETGHRTATVCNIGNIGYQLRRTLQWNPLTEKFIADREADKLLKRPMHHQWSIDKYYTT